MVRKTKEEAQETYTALLNAAEQVFSAKGVTNTTLNDVAQAAGMTRGAIYWHFKDKNALFQAMCDRAFLPMEGLLNEIAGTPQTDPITALRELNLHFLQLVSGDQQQRRVFDIIFHRCEKNLDLPFFETEQEKRTECLSKVESIIQHAVRIGQLHPDTDSWIAMQANHAFLVGIVHEWLEDPSAYSLADHAEDMIDMFLAGLFARPPLKKKSKESS
ncbi:TetR family transcriptional regulator [Undibacterium griseum]|uniref:TetR family transcriptional regulator n=1 Tax=Undibacterium griseum TaxID=2762295 RepID=A0ABR6YL00_9BURK|nr:TetR family transcriptional regulator [Undibacterium griseum]MBC3884539.1 TetR family transcriptional regulator [Undibacterium griseum]